MKRILLFFAIISNAAITHAGITDICQTTIEGCNGTGNIYKLEFELDTTINGNQYFYSQIYPGIFIREEGQKILLRNTYDNIDLTLYDFSLNKGDSLPNIWFHGDVRLSSKSSGNIYFSYYPGDYKLGQDSTFFYYYIDSVSSFVDPTGKERKMQYLSGNGMRSEIIVEGIGDIEHGFFYPINRPISTCGPFWDFLCHAENGECIYRAPDAVFFRNNLKLTHCACCNFGYVTTADTWHCVETDTWLPIPNGRKITFYLEGDTVIKLPYNNPEHPEYDYIYMIYKKLYKDEYGKKQYYGALRETISQKQVYWHRGEKDYLLYDFDASVGDTVNAYWSVYDIREYIDYMDEEGDTLGWYVQNKDTIDGRIVIDVVRCGYSYHKTRWIQGIGTANGLWGYHYGDVSSSTIYSLCAARGDEVLWSYTLPADLRIVNNGPDFSIDVTKVENLSESAENLDLSAPMYNVLGQPVDKDYHGIVIQNGRKYVR